MGPFHLKTYVLPLWKKSSSTVFRDNFLPSILSVLLFQNSYQLAVGPLCVSF